MGGLIVAAGGVLANVLDPADIHMLLTFSLSDFGGWYGSDGSLLSALDSVRVSALILDLPGASCWTVGGERRLADGERTILLDLAKAKASS